VGWGVPSKYHVVNKTRFWNVTGVLHSTIAFLMKKFSLGLQDVPPSVDTVSEHGPIYTLHCVEGNINRSCLLSTPFSSRVRSLQPAGQLRPTWTFNMACIRISLPKLQHNIMSKQNSMRSRRVDSKSREVHLTPWHDFSLYFSFEDKGRILR